jgi:hypothetical protein
MLDQAYEIFSKWLYIEDREAIEIVLAVGVCSQMPGDPVWLFLVGPSGSTKTEIVRSLKNSSRVYTTDTLTAKSLISGWRQTKKREQVDLLPQLAGKLLIIKDFTSMLSRPDIEINEVFGTLRGAYDGYYESVYGSGVGKKSFTSTFGIIACVTPVIEVHSKVHNLLGERFLKLRDRYNRKKSVESAMRHSGNENQMRDEIAEIMRIAFDYYSLMAANHTVRLTDKDRNQIAALADVLTILRSGVARDRQRQVKYQPVAEVATRVSKQLLRLATALDVMNIYSYDKLLRIARDSVPTERLRFVKVLLGSRELDTTEIMKRTILTRSTVLITSEDLWLLGAVSRTDSDNPKDSAIYHSLKPEFRESLINARI